MLNPIDRRIAQFVLKGMMEMYLDGKFTHVQFDGELMSYLQELLNKGMDIVEIRELTTSVGMDIHVNVRIMEGDNK